MATNSPTFGQLCTLAREVILTDLTMDDAEWKEQLKVQLVTLGFDYPDRTEQYGQALSAVQRALEKRRGPRPTPDPPIAPPTPVLTQDDPPWRGFHRQEGMASLSAMIASLDPSGCSSTTSAEPPESHEDRVRRQIAEWRAEQQRRPAPPKHRYVPDPQHEDRVRQQIAGWRAGQS